MKSKHDQKNTSGILVHPIPTRWPPRSLHSFSSMVFHGFSVELAMGFIVVAIVAAGTEIKYVYSGLQKDQSNF